MAWLLHNGVVLAAVEIATGRGARRRGLLGRDAIDGALLLQPARSVHTIGMRFPIDVAYCALSEQAVASCDADGGESPAEPPLVSMVVLDARSMRPSRLGRPRLRANCVIEAEAGAFERWQLRPGDHLEIR